MVTAERINTTHDQPWTAMTYISRKPTCEIYIFLRNDECDKGRSAAHGETRLR